MLRPPIAALAVLLAASALPARSALLPEEENTIKVFKEAAASTVFVTNIAVGQNIFMDEVQEKQGAGSGIVWDKDGHIVTNFHVVDGGNAFLVTLPDRTELDADVVGVEPRKDIAVLQVHKHLGKLVPIKLGDSQGLQVGQETLAIGNPFGLDNTLTKGIVSATGRQVKGIGGVTIHDMIQTDAAINPGNSGGPLLDSSGRLIGMNTMIYSESGSNAGVGFAVPVIYLKRIVPQIIKYGKTLQPGIGVSVLSEDQTQGLLGDIDGVVVRGVRKGSPAALAGVRGLRREPMTGRIRLGDIITGVDGHKVKDFDDLYNVLDNYRVGDTVVLHTVRDGRPKAYRIQLVNVD